MGGRVSESNFTAFESIYQFPRLIHHLNITLSLSAVESLFRADEMKNLRYFPHQGLGVHTVDDSSDDLMDLPLPLSLSAGKSSSIESEGSESTREDISCSCSGDGSADSPSGSKSSNSAIWRKPSQLIGVCQNHGQGHTYLLNIVNSTTDKRVWGKSCSEEGVRKRAGGESGKVGD